MTHGLGAIAWEFGDECDIVSPSARSDIEGDPSELLAMGFKRFLRSDRSVSDLGVSSFRKSLSAAGLAPNDIDAIVFCSSTYPGRVSSLQMELEARLRVLQMRRANLHLLSFGRCSNVASALLLAESLIAQGSARRVGIITADKHAPELGPRNSQNNTQVMSDAAASCIIGEGMSAFEIRCVVRRSDLTITSDALVGPAAVRVEAYTNYHRLIRELQLHGLHLPDAVVTHNMALCSMRAMASELGVPTGLLIEDNVASMGHAFGADGLVNLQTSRERLSRTNDRCRVVMLLTGVNTHSLVQVDIMPASPSLHY